jgi:uncharacterized protein (TIGR02453 family)
MARLPEPLPQTSFAGFGPDFLAFFGELEANNTKDWFHANKARYEASVHEPFRDLLAATNTELAKRGVPLSADPKRSVSRINRDIRFSTDKSPYTTYIAGTLTREPGEMSPGLIYVQLAPSEMFVGAGFYEVQPGELLALRQAIRARPDDWLAIESDLAKAGHPLSRENTLKRMPKGFEDAAEEPVAETLRLKAFVAKLMLTPADLASPKLPERIGAFGRAVRPLLRFGWDAVGKQ